MRWPSFFRKKTSVKDNNVESAVQNGAPMISELSGDDRADKQNDSKGEQGVNSSNVTEVKIKGESPAEDSMPINGETGKVEESESNSSEDQSIYSVITSHLTDGVLPDDFTLGEKYDTGFVPGAKDGIALYHMHPVQWDLERGARILDALTCISEEEGTEYVGRIMAHFEALDNKDSIVRLYDEIIHAIDPQKMNLEAILNFGDYLISYGVSLLAVKAGLTLLAGFKVPFVEDVCLELGAYEEFTYYAARILSNGNWEDGNEKLFRLAKQLHGWGRIHAVAYIKADTQEIKDWLLYHGAENEIVPQYSADDCLRKAGVIDRLNAGTSDKEFQAIGRLIEYSLEAGPCPGLSNPEQLLPCFLNAAKNHPVNRELIRSIHVWVEENMENNLEIIKLVDELLG